MVPILRKLENVDFNNPREGIRQMAEHIRDLENQLEDLLMKIDNVNMLTLDLDDMTMRTENGSVISGDKVKIKGPGGQVFEVGYDKELKQFVFNIPYIDEINVGTLNATNITRGGEEL